MGKYINVRLPLDWMKAYEQSRIDYYKVAVETAKVLRDAYPDYQPIVTLEPTFQEHERVDSSYDALSIDEINRTIKNKLDIKKCFK